MPPPVQRAVGQDVMPALSHQVQVLDCAGVKVLFTCKGDGVTALDVCTRPLHVLGKDEVMRVADQLPDVRHGFLEVVQLQNVVFGPGTSS